MLADVFENFRNKCTEIYETDPVHFLSVPGLAWEAYLKKIEIRLELLTGIDMLLIVETGINKYMKNYNKNIASSYLMYLDARYLYGWAMSQKLPINDFEWVE